MRRSVLMIVAAILLTLSMATVVNAEPNLVFLDYSFMNLDRDSIGEIDVDTLTLGYEYSDRMLFGFFYEQGLGYEPDTGDPSSSLWLAYGGYNLVKNERGSFGLILGYGSFSYHGHHIVRQNQSDQPEKSNLKCCPDDPDDPDEPDQPDQPDQPDNPVTTKLIGDDYNLDSFSIGFKGVLKMEALNLSLLYLYGFNNELEYNGHTNDADFSLIELKAGYNFTEAFGVYLCYRNYSMDVKGDDGDLSGFGLGFQWGF